MRTARILTAGLASGLLALAAASTGGASAASTSEPAPLTPPRIGWWAGQNFGVCGSDILSCPRDNSAYTPEVWDALEDGNGFLGFDLVYGSDFGPDIAGVARRTDALPILHEANDRGVELKAWITVPFKKGTFANENNAQIIQDAVKAFKPWAAANNLVFEEITLDLEFPLGYQQINDAIEDGNTEGLKQHASANLNPGHQCEAIAKYKQTINWAHANGLKLTGSPILFALDDVQDGNLALSDLLDMAPVMPEYDMQYLQAYRAFGVDLGSAIVADYYTEMQQRFGAKGQVTIGNTGLPPYTTATGVANDIRMLAALGASEIPIFDFDSSVKTYGAAGIRQILAAAHDPMGATELAAARQPAATGVAARALFRGLDVWAAYSTPWFTALAWRPDIPNLSTDDC